MGIKSHIYTLTTCVNIIVMAFSKMFVFAIWFHFAVVEHTQYCIYLPCFFHHQILIFSCITNSVAICWLFGAIQKLNTKGLESIEY